MSTTEVPRFKSTACQHCHSKKVRCSGDQPCANCQKSGHNCVYPSRNRHVRVSENYIKSLVTENKRLKATLKEAERQRSNVDDGGDGIAPAAETNTPDDHHDHEDAAGVQVHLESPGQPWFVEVDLPHTPTPINEAADTAYATRFRQVLSDWMDPADSASPCLHLPRIDYAGDDTIMSLAELPCPWPKPSRARLLMDVALMHANKNYHIVRRRLILEAMESSLPDPTTWRRREPVMTAKLWALFGLGELCSSRFVAPGREFPGSAYFAQATKMLNYLGERPTLDFIEIRLLLSLYSFTLNRVYASWTLAGSALRMAVIMGLHLNMPSTHLDDAAIREHRNRLWWTAYMLDRLHATKLGCPPGIQDEHVQVDFPSTAASVSSDDFADPCLQAAYAKLATISMNVVQSIYNGQPRDRTPAILFQKVQQRLKELNGWVQDLPSHLRLDAELRPWTNYDVLSMHLTLNQTIILATRPILLYGLRLHFSPSPGRRGLPKPIIPDSAKTLIDTCTRCARHSCRILSQSWVSGAFPALFHDLTQYLFSALTILAASSLLPSDSPHGSDKPTAAAGFRVSDREAFEESVQLLSQLKDSGNFPAREYYRHVELIVAAIKKVDEKRDRQSRNKSGVMNAETVPLHRHGGVQPPSQDQTAETALAEPSLQELLMQSTAMTEMQFLDSGIGLFGDEGELYWPEFCFQG
ncbi:fungal-specific transcription factor domain-containing protein [Cladorrhinum sp. PSN332]|nr:fungal-specific transcription factor domain-containing protein [Cladorrhinum sp. PSN332]